MNMNTIKKRKRTVHDLGQVHTVLVSLATSLQLKVERDIQDMMEMGSKLAHEMYRVITTLGEVMTNFDFVQECLSRFARDSW